MELQEPVLRSVLTDLRFESSPWFAQRRAELLEEIRDATDLRTWSMNEQLIQIFNDGDPDRLIQVSPGSATVSWENPGSETKAITEAVLKAVLRTLKVEQVTYIGARSMWLAAADDFESLRDELLRVLASPVQAIFGQTVGQKPSDVGWVFEFRTTQPQHVLRLGPMTDQQAMTQVFRGKDSDTYPPQFLFLDLDRLYNEQQWQSAEVIERWRTTYDRCLEVAAQISMGIRSAL